MSIIKYIANSDTTITNAFKPGTLSRAFYANMGAADSLEVFSIAHTGSTAEKSRILLNFPLDKIENHRQSGVIPSSGSVNFILKLYNVEHPETLPSNYDVVLKPISGSWDEGYGLDLDTYSDTGQMQTNGFGANWKFRSTTDYPFHWFSDGGDFWDGYEKIFHIENGTEDIEVDITDIVEDQINNTISRNGIAVMLSHSFEEGNSGINYYTKRFSARSSEYYYKLPCIEARWETVVKDDRGNFYYKSNNLTDEDNIQNIYFYNRINGVLKNLPDDIIPIVKIYSGTQLIVDNISSYKVSTGVYKAPISITGSEDKTLNDVWYNLNKEYFTGTINAKIRNFDDSYTDSAYVFNIKNLKNIYKNTELPIFRVFARKKDWDPTIYSIASNEIELLTLNNLYYKVIRIVDNFTVIDYGVSPIPYTKCSYDKNGNYFILDMAFFEPGYSYGIKLMTIENDIRNEYREIFKFKVE